MTEPDGGAESSRRAPTTVEDYLASVSPDRRTALEELRRTIRAAAPDATESIAYGMPAYRGRRRQVLVSFAAFRDHVSVFPASAAVQAELGAEIAPYLSGKATLRFAVGRPIPLTLVTRLVEIRIAEDGAAAPGAGG